MPHCELQETGLQIRHGQVNRAKRSKTKEELPMDKLTSLRNFVKEVYQVWINEKPNQLAAALAYFGMFSFAAVIYLAYRLPVFLSTRRLPRNDFTRALRDVLGPETAAYIQDSVVGNFGCQQRWIMDCVIDQPVYPAVRSDGTVPAAQVCA